MTANEQVTWDIWIDYCRKLDRWYKCNPDQAAEYEPILMTPPFDGIVEANLSADRELKERRKDEKWLKGSRCCASSMYDGWAIFRNGANHEVASKGGTLHAAIQAARKKECGDDRR